MASRRFLVEARVERTCLPASTARTAARTSGDDAFLRVLWGNKETDKTMSITT